VNLDWRRLRAVVLESDDWGLCAWAPDEQAQRVLADTPAFRSTAGRRYGGSTLENAADVRALADLMLEFRGGDGFPPVWQANTVMAAPDYERLQAPLFEIDSVPLVDLPEFPSRWKRPGPWDAVTAACDAGVWRPELHGHHHLPERAWLTALRRGAADARRAHEVQSPICAAVEASGEYDPSEPAEVRARNLDQAVAKFTRLLGRGPQSFCPPDYRWDDTLEAQAERLGVTTLQGKAEQMGPRFPKLRHLLLRHRWPHRRGGRFYLPPRIAFEPGRGDRPLPVLVERARDAVRQSWSRGQPAVISTHRVNYVHLDATRATRGRAALRDLLQGLSEDGATFLADMEVRQLEDRGWSIRDVGARGALLRYHGVPREPVRFRARAGISGVAVRDGLRPDGGEIAMVDGEVVARLEGGGYLLEWTS
jgi:hypothetical protein